METRSTSLPAIEEESDLQDSFRRRRAAESRSEMFLRRSCRSHPDGKAFVFSSSSMASPAEIYTSNVDGSGLTALTSVNAQLMRRANLKPAEEIEWTGALGKRFTVSS